MKKLSEILKNLVCKEIIGDENVEISGVNFDSRKVTKGDLFVAKRGDTTDGHDFILKAIEQGAVAVVCEKLPAEISDACCYVVVPDSAEALGQIACAWYDYPSEKLKLVGVTGTNGKTTVATLLYQLFRQLGYKVGLLSTVENRINDQIVEAKLTTPESLEINELLTKMLEVGCEYAFMEVSSHSVAHRKDVKPHLVAHRRVAGLHFAGAIFTNLTQDHLDFHGTMENYRDAKKRFFDELPAEAFAITNLDDKNGEFMLQNTRAKKYTYTLRAMGDFKTKVLENDFSGMLLSVNGREVHVPFVGKFNASNITAVYGTAVLLGQDGLEVLRIISSLDSVSGRFETLRSPSGYFAIVDYAHTPDALKNVVGTINQILQGKSGRLITVVGCGGDRDKTKRPLMAQEAVNGSWKAVLTSDNPRTENPQEILNDMLAGLDSEQRKKTLVIADRREAIRTACTLAQSGDVVLVAGKGHENYQIIGTEKFHFDDREEVLEMF